MPNTRQISNEVYRTIKRSGVLGGLRGQVFDYIREHGPATIAEAMRDIGCKRDSSVNARFSELRKMELIEQVGTVPDPTGGKHAISQWNITGHTAVIAVEEKLDECFIVMAELNGEIRRGVRDTEQEARAVKGVQEIWRVRSAELILKATG